MNRVSESTVTIIQQMAQQDANLAGNVHGGTIMKLIDNTAGITAMRHTGCNVVTASIDQLDFHSPVYVGNLVRIISSINFIGKTSMEVGVRVEAENHMTSEVRHTASAYLTFVALDSAGNPREVPPLAFESPDEIRRNKKALERRRLRLAMRKKQ